MRRHEQFHYFIVRLTFTASEYDNTVFVVQLHFISITVDITFEGLSYNISLYLVTHAMFLCMRREEQELMPADKLLRSV